MTLFDKSLPPFMQLRPCICLYEVFRLCIRESDYERFPVFLIPSSENAHTYDWRCDTEEAPSFLAFRYARARVYFPHLIWGKRETPHAFINNFVFSLQVCLLSFIIVLHTVLYTLLLVLVRKLRLTIKKCLSCSSFSQNLYDWLGSVTKRINMMLVNWRG